MNVKELIEKYKRYEGKWNGKTGELARQIFLAERILNLPANN